MTSIGTRINDWRVDARIEHAQTLHPDCFRKPEFLEAELQSVFANRWLMLTPTFTQDGTGRPIRDFLDEQGGRIPLHSHARPLFLEAHTTTKHVRAFSNVCTHAWYPLVKAHNCNNHVQCEQHGRLFSEGGRCVAHPGFSGLPDFPDAMDHLPEYPLQWWHQLPFVSFGKPAVAFDAVFSRVQESICGLNMADLQYQPQAEECREINGNWKLHAWNFLDSFHIPHIHGGKDSLTSALQFSSYQTEVYESSVLQWAYARRPEHGFSPHQISPRFRDKKKPEKRVLALWWFVFPNLTLNFYPWGLSINLYEPHPSAPDKTRFRWYHFVQDQQKYAQRDPIWMNQKVDDEDVEALDLVRKNLQSPICRRGRFAPEREHASHWFHHQLSLRLSNYLGLT